MGQNNRIMIVETLQVSITFPILQQNTHYIHMNSRYIALQVTSFPIELWKKKNFQMTNCSAIRRWIWINLRNRYQFTILVLLFNITVIESLASLWSISLSALQPSLYRGVRLVRTSESFYVFFFFPQTRL